METGSISFTLEYFPKAGERLSCLLEHLSFKEPMVFDWGRTNYFKSNVSEFHLYLTTFTKHLRPYQYHGYDKAYMVYSALHLKCFLKRIL